MNSRNRNVVSDGKANGFSRMVQPGRGRDARQRTMAPTMASATTFALSRSMPMRSAVRRATLCTSSSCCVGERRRLGFRGLGRWRRRQPCRRRRPSPRPAGARLRLPVQQALHERRDHRLRLVLECRLQLAHDVHDHALGGLERDRGDEHHRRRGIDAEPQHLVRPGLAICAAGGIEVGLGGRGRRSAAPQARPPRRSTAPAPRPRLARPRSSTRPTHPPAPGRRQRPWTLLPLPRPPSRSAPSQHPPSMRVHPGRRRYCMP